ncbi:MAG: hypothetical protein LC104_20170 [Bacteroidales bacterium]|nr:hypothetical protein [Bacteroidales bacterium]
MVAPERKLTASQVILLAAADLAEAGNQEFSEWDLTVAAWTRDRFRFGLRGFAQTYPDHKRVMMEIMGQKSHSPVQQKFIEKIRPNYYRLTELGQTAAQRLLHGEPLKPEPVNRTKAVEKPAVVKDPYDVIKAFISRTEFRRWQDNPAEPRDWTGAARFLALSETELEPVDRLTEVRDAVKAAMDWCNDQEAVYLTRRSGTSSNPIHVRDLAELLDFLQALVYRFPEYLDRTSVKFRRR